MGIEKIKSDVYKAIDIERQRAMENMIHIKKTLRTLKVFLAY